MTVTTWQNIPDDVAENPSRPFPAPGEVSSRVVGGVLTTVGGRVAEMGTPHRATETDIAPSRGGILSTARNNAGIPTANIGPETTVEIPGLGRTSAKVAANLGYLIRTANGRFEEVSPSGKSEESSLGGDLGGSNNTDSQQRQQQHQADDSAEFFDTELEEAYQEMAREIPEGTYNSLMGGAVSLASRGEDIDTITAKLAPRVAEAAGLDPETVQANIEVASIAWQEQADSAVKAAGADPAEFYAWAKEHRRDTLQNAINTHLVARSTKGYREMIDDYFNSTMPTEKALRAAGIPIRKNTGETLVKVKGHWMSLGSAVKAGLL